jgi:hypothetical protein
MDIPVMEVEVSVSTVDIIGVSHGVSDTGVGSGEGVEAAAEEAAADGAADDGAAEGNSVCVAGQTVVYWMMVFVRVSWDCRLVGHMWTSEKQLVTV